MTNIFLQPVWIKTLEDTYGYEIFLIKLNKTEVPLMQVSGFLKNKLVCLPFSDFVLNDEKIDFDSLDKTKTYEFRGGISNEEFVTEKFYVHEVSLVETEEDIFKRFKSKTKRNIKKAVASGLTVTFSEQKKDLKIFMEQNYETRRKHGIPPQPDSFFENLYKNLITKGLGSVVVVWQNELPVSSSVILFHDDTMYYKYGASDLNLLNLRPNDLLFWELMKWSKDKGFKKLNLGKTDIDAEGLIRFKTSLGATSKVINYYVFPKQKRKNENDVSLLKKLLPIIQKTPIPVLRFLGNTIYKYFG